LRENALYGERRVKVKARVWKGYRLPHTVVFWTYRGKSLLEKIDFQSSETLDTNKKFQIL
jgi:pyridoxine/pyridoxamine 5'-phosphate oxidase